LELRVQERTAELANANQALQAEIAERKEAEALLSRRESYFRALIEHISDVVSILDRDGIVRYERGARVGRVIRKGTCGDRAVTANSKSYKPRK